MSGPPDHSWLSAADPDLWQHLVDRGVAPADATRHVLLRRQATVGNLPANIAKELDPGALASFGLGASDMMSFGLGDQIARAVQNVPGIGTGGTTALTQKLAASQHPDARLAGQIVGVLGPAGIEAGAAKLGLLAPSALTTAIRGIQSTPGRALAKTALNAATGAAYAGGQAAGHAEGGLTPRLEAAEAAAPYGAVAGATLPWLLGSFGAAAKGAKNVAGKVAGRVAGPAAEVAPTVAEGAPASGLLPSGVSEAAARASLAKQGFSAADIEKAIAMAKAPPPVAPPVSQEPILPALRAAADPMETVPAFARNPTPGGPAEGLLPWYPRGGAAEQALTPRPAISPATGTGLPLAQLKLLMQLPPDQFASATALFPPEILDQLHSLRAGLLTGAM